MLQFKTKEPDIPVQADVKTLMRVFALSPMEAKLVHAMINNSWAGPTEIPESRASIRQTIFTMRRKLQGPHGIWILNDGQGRYTLPPSSKMALARALERAEAEFGE